MSHGDPGAPSLDGRTLDGRTFRLTSSTFSDVDADAPTRFRYRERDGVVWGDYDGDTVAFGRFVGTRAGDALEVAFVHVLVAGGTASGRGSSRVEVAAGGLRLVERFSADGAEQVSVCEEEPQGAESVDTAHPLG